MTQGRKRSRAADDDKTGKAFDEIERLVKHLSKTSQQHKDPADRIRNMMPILRDIKKEIRKSK
jgi:hypothetical protein